MTSLTELDLSDNNIASLPAELVFFFFKFVPFSSGFLNLCFWGSDVDKQEKLLLASLLQIRIFYCQPIPVHTKYLIIGIYSSITSNCELFLSTHAGIARDKPSGSESWWKSIAEVVSLFVYFNYFLQIPPKNKS